MELINNNLVRDVDGKDYILPSIYYIPNSKEILYLSGLDKDGIIYYSQVIVKISLEKKDATL